MRRSGLFRRFYLTTAFIVLVFIFIGFMASRLAIRLGATPSPYEGRHFVFYAKLIDRLSAPRAGEPSHSENRASSRQAALAEISSWDLFEPSLHLALVNPDGSSVFGPPLPFEWARIQKPEQPYEFRSIGEYARRSNIHGLIRLAGDPPQYLYVDFERAGGASRHVPGVFFWSLGSMIVSVLMGIALSMILLFRALREKASLADEVLAEMQHGNLKARFPIKRMDEIGQAMSRFNRMADEIERLVEQSKGAEKARMKLLQELAHDLRTPVASQKNLLETLINKGEGVAPSLRRELLSLALTEAEYFERLIEDLLVLAQVSEPRYRIESERVRINDLVREEAENIAAQTQSTGGRISLKNEVSGFAFSVSGDSHLLRRMIRNALSNAFSFARSEVRVSIEREAPAQIAITVEDDGEGFTEEGLSSFGVRRVTRALGSDRKGKISVGLGSVILKAVAETHGGSVRIGNGPSGGARVTILLPAMAAEESDHSLI